MKKDGGPAFPGGQVGQGMSLRDWFAGQALGSLLLASAMRGINPGDALVVDAYAIADAMIAEREK